MLKLCFWSMLVLGLAEMNLVMGGCRHHRKHWRTTTTTESSIGLGSTSARLQSESSYSLLTSLKCISAEQREMIESCNSQHSNYETPINNDEYPKHRKRRAYPFTPSGFAVCLVSKLGAYNNVTGKIEVPQLEQGMIEKSTLTAAAKKLASDTLTSCLLPSSTEISAEQIESGEDDYTINDISKGLLCSAEALLENGCNAIRTSRLTEQIASFSIDQPTIDTDPVLGPKFEKMKRHHGYHCNDTSSSEEFS